MINFLFCMVLLPGASKSWPNSQILWFFKSDTVISNDTVQCFDWNRSCQKLHYKQQIHDQLSRIHSFNWSGQISAISQKKIVFWSTLEAPSEKTEHLQELVMVFKVVVNNIVDIIIPINLPVICERSKKSSNSWVWWTLEAPGGRKV